MATERNILSYTDWSNFMEERLRDSRFSPPDNDI